MVSSSAGVSPCSSRSLTSRTCPTLVGLDAVARATPSHRQRRGCPGCRPERGWRAGPGLRERGRRHWPMPSASLFGPRPSPPSGTRHPPKGTGAQRRGMRGEIAEGIRFVLGSLDCSGPSPRRQPPPTCSRACDCHRDRVPRAHRPRGAGRHRPGLGLRRRGRRPRAAATDRIGRWIGGVRATILGIALNAGILLLPLSTTASAPVLFSVGLVRRRVRSRHLQREPGELSPALCPPELLGTHERNNALRRLGRPAPRRARWVACSGQKVGLRPTLWIGAVGAVSAIGWLLASPLVGHARNSRRRSAASTLP